MVSVPYRFYEKHNNHNNHNNHELSLMVGLLFYISDQMLEPLLFYSKMANRNNEALIKV